ncbi:clavaldehyde dehydrogenase [Escherichia coli]|nr:clavaldehyde dehydrogenase [Escherichia coli]SRA89360.1 clavaldehyde dehydrogenase [Escherichia coli]STG58776.1 clavaldehyde dehydrogenase [Escherichia coli]STJ50836.1 clavaldehyde dehydrogenase [Escherichia coli]
MDKVILITGASSGIGEGIARELGMTGAKVLLGARRVERIEAIATEICRAGGIAKARELDVTDRQSMADFVQAALDSWGELMFLSIMRALCRFHRLQQENKMNGSSLLT